MFLVRGPSAIGFIISVDSVYLSVCQTITFERLHAGSSYLHMPSGVSPANTEKFVYEGHRVKVKVTKPNSPQRYTRNGYLRVRTDPRPCSVKILASITHRAVNCACTIDFSPTANRMA